MGDYTLVLIIIGLVATLILAGIYIWQTFFWSWRRIVSMILMMFTNSKDMINPDAEIKPSSRVPRSEKLKERALESDVVFETRTTETQVKEVPQAKIPIQERGELAWDTSDNGYPRRLTEEEKQDTRPFRNLRLDTENEDLMPKANTED